jgi:hypothetical protein
MRGDAAPTEAAPKQLGGGRLGGLNERVPLKRLAVVFDVAL